jgi:hypothetical protein
MVDYALTLKTSGAITSPDFAVTPAMRDELYQRLQARGIEVPRAVYDSAAPLVSRALGTQVTRFVFGQRAEFARGLRQDSTLAKALDLLQGVSTPRALLDRGRK